MISDGELKKTNWTREWYNLLKKLDRVKDYIDMYIHLIDKDIENFELWLQTKDPKYRKQSNEAAEMLQTVVRKALNDKLIQEKIS